MRSSIRNTTGAVVRGKDFFDRQNEMASYWNRLQTDNLLLLAPRRVGKTSILYRMQETAVDHGYQAIFFDACDCTDELAFVHRFYKSILETDCGSRLWEKFQESSIGKTIGRVGKIGGGGFSVEFKDQTADWAKMGEELAHALQKLDGRWLIQIDELPVFVLKLLGKDKQGETNRVAQFLYWLRRLRLQFPNLRWMLAGSIGLDTVAARIDVSDTINDLAIEKLGPFEKHSADLFLQELASSYDMNLSGAVRSRILKRVGWLAPYFLQLVFHQLKEIGKKPNNKDVDESINRLLQPDYKTHFDHWRQRLKKELGSPESGFAIDLLTAAAADPQGATHATLAQVLTRSIPEANARQEMLRYLLDVLSSDGYLVQHKHNYLFRIPLLREYWTRRFATAA